MKDFLTVLAVLFSGVVGEAAAQYPPSGWRPNGPAFELPQGTQRPIKQEYLPPSPVDPRVPAVGPTALPGDDVSVQGLPTPEQLPIFQVSPVNGQQYAGPSFNADLQNLDQDYRQSQFQLQQQKAREFERQRQIDAQLARRQSTPQTPRQFVQRTTTAPEIDESKTTEFDSTTEAISLNEGEILEDDSRPAVPARQKGKVSVEVTKQNIQEYPPELFLSPLTQLNYQPRIVPLEQLRAAAYYQPIQQDASQKQVAPAFDGLAHLSALSSILGQRQTIQPQQQQQYTQGFMQGPIVLVAGGQGEDSKADPEPQYQQVLNQYQPISEQEQYQPQQYQPQQYQPQQYQPQQYQPQQYQPQQYQPQQYQPQPYQPQPYQPQQLQSQQYQPQQLQSQQLESQLYQPQQIQPQQYQPQQYQPQQYQPQQVVIQPQPLTQQPNQYPVNQNEEGEPLQLVYQQAYQPQNQQQQSQLQQTQLGQYDQNQQNLFLGQNQDLNQYYLNQQQLYSQNQPLGSQDALQSGLDINQQGNDIDEVKQNSDEENRGATVTAVATAFGTRTQPRIPNQYGVPASNPRTQANPGLQTTTEVNDREDVTESNLAIAQATAVGQGGQRKTAKLSTRRIRPVFTLDRSGHLVLAREQ